MYLKASPNAAAAVQMFGCYVKLKLSFVIYIQFELELQTTHRFS